MNLFMRHWPLCKIAMASLCFCIAFSASAQITDTVSLSLHQAEKLFIDSNLNLLASRYNIDANRAAVLQARLLSNPSFSVGHALYSGSLRKFFPLGANDETYASISQLVLLAGKRNKQVKLAEANATLTEYQFFDLLRTLKYELHSNFYNIYFLRQSAKVYNAEINALQQIVTAFQQQQGKGYIAQSEVVRIRAQLYSFTSEYSQLVNQITDLESNLRLLVRIKPSTFINPVADTTEIEQLDPSRFPIATLLDSAYHNRTDLSIAKENTTINRLNYNYQRALAVPDLSVSVGYDEQGSFLNNLISGSVGIDVPIFNRNQGNIKQAKILIQNTAALQRSTEETVSENVSNALQKAYVQDKMYKSIDKSFMSSFSYLLQEVIINYQRRNISLLEFLDFYDSYKLNTLQINAVQYNRVQAFEDINFYTATNFY